VERFRQKGWWHSSGSEQHPPGANSWREAEAEGRGTGCRRRAAICICPSKALGHGKFVNTQPPKTGDQAVTQSSDPDSGVTRLVIS